MNDRETLSPALLDDICSAHASDRAPLEFRTRMLSWVDTQAELQPIVARAQKAGRSWGPILAAAALALGVVAITTFGHERFGLAPRAEPSTSGGQQHSAGTDSTVTELTGTVVAGTLSHERHPCGFRFLLQLRAPAAGRVWVHHAACTLPDTLSDAKTSIVVTARGQLRGDQLEATSLIAR
jgi:hypothetical protein